VGPSELILVRHGESVGNVEREQAEAEGAEVIPIEWRDADTPLSDHGARQADAFGRWLAEQPVPAAVWCSPYRRAHDTAQHALEAAGLALPLRVDERLRDRELGILDRLTTHGVASRYPTEADRKRELGKFYYRPPGGESWVDVALRVRSFLRDLATDGTVLVCSHDAVIFLFRYVLQGLEERTLLTLANRESVPNASVTRFARSGTDWELVEFGTVDHLVQHGVEPTHHGAGADGPTH
jgi:broad specificity phosphatase PhoE